ncbi:MAG: hypothetical protein WEB06_01050 [Actinomycetota bacterium]
MRRILTAIAIVGLLAGVFPARGATPDSGTVSPTSPTLSYQGAELTGAPIAGPPLCVEGVICDTFTLTLEVPAGFYETETRELVASISWEDNANDLDLFVCPGTQQEDPECSDGTSELSAGTDSETIVIKEPQPGTYRVIAVAYGGTTAYEGSIGFLPPPKPAAPSLVTRPGDLTAETTGDGRLIASIAFPGGTDLDFSGTLAFVGSYDGTDGGLRIFDIADPRRPRLIGRFPCSGNQNDVGVYRTTVVMGMHSSGSTPGCTPVDEGGLRIIDVTDPTRPTQTAFVKIGPAGTHTLTIVGDTGYVYANPGGLGTSPDEFPTTIVDIRDPSNPKIVGTWTPPQSLGCHDINVVGNRAYCAGSNVTHIMDITDPVHPTVVSSIFNPVIQLHHGAAPSSDGKVLVIADEAIGAHLCDPAGANPTGAYWFYDISDEHQPVLRGWTGTPGLTDVAVLGYVCTAHNFNMVPDRPWMVAASYTAGTSIIDFTDPAAPTLVAQVRGAEADTWSSYFHNGFIFTGDRGRGFDVIEHPELTALAPAGLAAPQPASPKPAPQPSVRSGRALPGTGLESGALGLTGGALLAGATAVGVWSSRSLRGPSRRQRRGPAA